MRRHGLGLIGFDQRGFGRLAAPAPAATAGTGGRRTRIRPVAAPAEQGLAFGDFVELISPVLRVSRDHELTGPAGRPLEVHHPIVPLRAAKESR